MRDSAPGAIRILVFAALALAPLDSQAASAAPVAPEGWQALAPRDEIRPQFSYNPKGGPAREGSLVIRTGTLEGFDGHWAKTFPVKGGQYYRFHALRRVEHVSSPRRDVLARILWRDDHDRPAVRDEPGAQELCPRRAAGLRARIPQRRPDRRGGLD